MIPILVSNEKCLYPESWFAYIFDFMKSHSKQFEFMCVWCPFGFCYRYFLGIFAIFQMAHSLRALSRLLQTPQDDVWINVPFFPITHHNFDMISHALNLSSCFDLFIRVLTSKSADELAVFTMYSFVMLIYSLVYFVIKFGTFTMEQRVIQSIMNMASILNFMFLVCFIFEHCDHGLIVHNHEEY